MFKNFMPILGLTFFLFCSHLHAEIDRNYEGFCSKYPGPAYQDLWINNRCVRPGTDVCSTRYEMLLPILNQYTAPFSVLDLGAAQGYFSFRIAENYPHAQCIMVGTNTNYYGNHGDMLYDLCHLNNHLKNVVYLNKLIDLEDLRRLSSREHFDVLLALLVVHQIDESLPKRALIIDALLELADHVIIEVSNDVAPELASYVENLSKKIKSIYLGEVRRHYNFSSTATGKLYCFTKDPKSTQVHSSQGISSQTFTDFHGVYPE